MFGDLTVLVFCSVGLILTAVFVFLWWSVLRNGGEREIDRQVDANERARVALEAGKDQPLSEKLEAVLKPEPLPPAVEKDVDLKKALSKTEENIFGRIKSLFVGEDTSMHLEEIEEVLYTSDLGPQTVQRLMSALEDLNRKEKGDYAKVRATLKQGMSDVFAKLPSSELKMVSDGPTVIMVVGVNGAGKTTSIGKLSSQFALSGKKVLVAAGDTFRAAAGGQLKVWTDRAQVEIFSPDGVTDPSAVAYDAVAKAKGQGYDIVIIDTAGRLHTQANLMEELKKMKRVMTKVIADAPHEVIIVLDANSGQNALIQAKEYNAALGLTGAILTKMDGTAKGGVAVGLANELRIPIKFIGVGERIQDLRSFSSQEFVESIFS
ncbi:MAG: signal recognition particle-docking protein FtsY [Bdellovibrionaceae bacterium]|nr:signal recognition particle-docking protein FtsY [Pseudobdellovibrionaceae bacterium]